MKKIKIFEMFLRDGLQSYKTVYTVPQKISFFNHLHKCNYDCIEFGSTTSPKLIPQIGGSFELWDHIKTLPHKSTNYTMLVPSSNHLEKVQKEGVHSFGLVTSLSDEFSQRNMKMSGSDSVQKAIEMSRMILSVNKNAHIRVYISCSFGCPWEGFTEHHIAKLKTFTEQLMELVTEYKLQYNQFDIVLADTVGMCTEERMRDLLNLNKDNPYLALHMHFMNDDKNNQSFERVVDIALDLGVEKFDTSLLGIGGCPYAKKAEGQTIGNLSTRPFVEFLHKQGIKTEIKFDELIEAEKAIHKEMN